MFEPTDADHPQHHPHHYCTNPKESKLCRRVTPDNNWNWTFLDWPQNITSEHSKLIFMQSLTCSLYSSHLCVLDYKEVELWGRTFKQYHDIGISRCCCWKWMNEVESIGKKLYLIGQLTDLKCSCICSSPPRSRWCRPLSNAPSHSGKVEDKT